MSIAFTLNGAAVGVRADHPHLLAALREELDVTSPKDGCSPTGQCGCCTVLVDGKAVVACQQPLTKIEGKAVTTLEGFDESERRRYADAFAACGGLQCGFCIPGIVVRAKALVDRKGADLAREDAARLMGGHLCRCTGYVKILDAVEAVAKGKQLVPESPGGIGTSGVKYEAAELALGDRGYVDDIRVPGLLHAALHLTAHARADVHRIGTESARRAPGVVGAFTAADIPAALRVGIIHTDWPVVIPEGGRTSYAGDVLAVVVAETRQQARAAAALVEVDYGVLPPVTDPAVAIEDGEIAVWGTDTNVLSVSEYARGDVDAALAGSAHVVHETFRTQRIEHAFLEPEATLAVPDEAAGTMHVYSGGQGVWDDRNQIASVLGIDPARVTVELVSNGGAFGGKEDMSNQAQTALAAWLLQRPVKCVLSREESLLIHPKRHPITMEYWVGCDADGGLTGLRARMLGDSGAYASVGMKVLERAAGHASGPYRLPTIDVRSVAARTNNPVCGAFRGFGANQAQFAMEGCLDRLAELVGVSGWEIRKRNVIHPGEIWGPGQLMDDGCLGAERCLDEVRPFYDAAVSAGRAVGLGLGLKNSGLGNGFKEHIRAVVHFAPDGTVEVRHCWTEMGQGVHTVALQVAVTELGIDPDRVRVHTDTTRELGAGQTTGSRGTLMGAGAVADACRNAVADGCRVGVDYEGEYRVDWTHHLGEPGIEHPVIHSAFGYAAQLVVMDPRTQAIDEVVAVHDVGRAVNPLLCEGQIEGSVHMGLGYALTEDFPSDPETGFPTNMTLRSLDILRPKDVPPVRVVMIECPQPKAPYGIKGVGEIGLVPTAPAVAAALHAADGTWRATLPMKPSVPQKTDLAGTEATAQPLLGGAVTSGAVTPGMVCAHHHLYSVLARGMPAPPRSPDGFLGILEQVWWRLDAALDLDMLRWSALLGATEALLSGTTCIVDHHESPFAIEGSLSVIADACAEVGVRVDVAYGVTDRWDDRAGGPPRLRSGDWPPSAMTAGARRGLAENERFLRAGGRGHVGVHAAFTCADETLEAAAGLAQGLGRGVHIHVAEGLEDVAAGRRLEPLAREDWLLVHAVHLDRELPGIIAHNPRSNMNNAVGYGRPARWSQPVVLGTDGIGADMLEEVRLAYVRLREDDVTASPERPWAWLEAGRRLFPEAAGDRVTWNYDHAGSPWHVAFTPGMRAVRVEAGGEVLLEDGRPTRVDLDEVRTRAAEQADRLHARL